MKVLLSLTLILLLVESLCGQDSRQRDGQLITTTTFVLDAAELASLRGLDPDLPQQVLKEDLMDLRYWSDGLQINALLASPHGPGNYPCIILNRGGNRDFGAWTHTSFAELVSPWVSSGYVVIASQYRGSPGSEGKDEMGGKDIDDIMNLFPIIDSLPKVDHTRVGMYGGSRGGLMTYLVLTMTSRIRAAVIRAGMSDAIQVLKDRPDFEQQYTALIPAYAQTKAASLEARSPVLWVEKLDPKTPILLMQGTADWRVNPEQGFAMGEALFHARHPFRLVMFEGGSHGLPEFRGEVNRLTISWFNDYLRDGKVWPSLDKHGD
jgi:dipeptidyl aminopeptidase/acylaminoacyl peptidase